MIKPSKPANTQDDCPLFKLAAETRNAIYALVFATETQEDGSVKLDDIPADNALTRTCQQIHLESHKMHKLASHNYPSHTFTLDVPDRKEGLSVPRLSNTFFQRMTSFRVTWRADERNNGKPLRFTSHFRNWSPDRSSWSVRVKLHDKYWRGKEAGDRLAGTYARVGRIVMNGWCGEWFASSVSYALCPGQEEEESIWRDHDVKMRMPNRPGHALW
jgi:hypothetical protein